MRESRRYMTSRSMVMDSTALVCLPQYGPARGLIDPA